MVKLLCNLAKESNLTYLPKVYKTYSFDSIPNMSQYPAGKRGKAGWQGSFVLLSAGPLEVLSLWDFALWGKFLLSEPQASSEIFTTLLAKFHRLSTSYGSEACSANESLPSRLPSLPGVRLHLNPPYLF